MPNWRLTTRVLCVTLATFLTATAQRALAQAPDAAIPRTADGKPNFAGIWQVLNSAAWNIQDHPAEWRPGIPIQFAIPGGAGVVEGDVIPYTAPAAAKQKDNFANRATLDPENNCLLPGVPRAMYQPFPFQILQTPKQLSMLFEYVHATRHIYLDSPHPKGPIEWWMGDSRAHWEGDTLVVDVMHFNADTWFDRAGNHHTEQLHLIERYNLMTPDHINYEVTVEDPKVFTRAWKMSMPFYRRKDRNVQLLDFECYAFGPEGAVSVGAR